MRVIKRSGEYELVNFEKIAQRLRKLCWGLSNVDIESVVAAVATNMVDEISTERLDILAADLCIARDTEHPDFGVLASRIAVSNLQKMTSDSIVETFERMRGVVSDEFLDRVNANAEDLQAMVCYSRDYDFDYFGVETLKKLYCGRVNEILVERPQHMYLRVSLAICGGEGDMARVKKTYDMMSTKMFTHASPTLFNAGMKTQQCSSCFLQTMGDSLDGIFGCIHDAARISKHGGGLGISISDVRSKGAPIRGTNGKSDGILPLLKVVNSVASYINQGGRRKGSAAMYLEPHHPDIFEFLDLKRPGGDEDLRCRDLFMALWVSDLFMKRVRAGSDWSLMDPSLCPGLSECHGAAFETLYAQYESEGRASRVVKARDLWNAILRAQTESGVPYILYKDAANSKSNQSSLGTIKSSNLCVAGSTKILTDEGYLPIGPLENQTVSVWNGEEFSECTVRKTGTLQKLVRVRFSNGSEISCTPYHKFYIQTESGTMEQVAANDLRLGQNLIHWELPTLKRECLSAKLRYLEDVFDDNVCFVDGNDNLMLQTNLILQTMGVHAAISRVDGSWRLEIDSTGLRHLIELGFRPKRMDPGHEQPRQNVRVVGICEEEERQDTYCFTEPLRHMGMFNGVLAGNCAEIIEFTSDDEVAVCTLASLGLPAFVKRGGRFDYAALHEAVRVVARNLDDVIDINAYPMDKARRSSQTHRPIGIGIQGLADVFAKLRIPFDSPEAARLNAEISATMYHAALDASADLAAEKGPYASFEGSPASRGHLQWDLWGIESPETVGGTLDWTALKSKIERHGLRNSLSIALMPTASTAQVFGNNESFEPFTSLIYTRRTLAGEFVVINRHLVRDLVKLRIWSPLVKNAIIRDAGSIQNVPEIPDDIKKLYRTVWELPQRVLVDQSAARGPYVCQSQSLNIFFERPTFEKLTALHMHGWKSGLKTGSYYIRSKPASHAARVTVDAEECVMCSA